AMFFAIRAGDLTKPSWVAMSAEKLLGAVWPVMVGCLGAWYIAKGGIGRRLQRLPQIPPGDIVVPISWIVITCRRYWRRIVIRRMPRWIMRAKATVNSRVHRVVEYTVSVFDRWWESEWFAGMMIGVLIVVLLLLLQSR
ncbi:MAG: hypothetical protein D6800_12905, partial [Candidatus Zixiibacteriota bacterium]